MGTVARLEWPNRAAVDSPAAVVDEIVCPRCAIQQGKHPTFWRNRKSVQLHLCASCEETPASPPSVMSPASLMRLTSGDSPHVTLSDGHPREPPRTTLRVATGQAYDVYDVQLPDVVSARTDRSGTPPVAPPAPTAGFIVAAPSPRRAGMASSLSTVSFASSTSFATRSETASKARPNPELAGFLPRHPSFATQTVVDAVVEAVSDSRDRPELTEDGTGGVYLIRSCSPAAEGEGLPSPVAVFKPSDEEAGSHNNPRGLRGAEHVMREGFRPGGGAARELLAYQLDRGFAGVPKTAVDKLLLRTRTGTRLSEQTGSIQQFVESHGDASEYRFDGSEFSLRASERIALQDIRLFNCDRHEGNVLVCSPKQDPWGAGGALNRHAPAEAAAADEGGEQKVALEQEEPKLDLVPIDHAFILPSFGYFREAELVWRYWLSAGRPFGREALEYVAALDAEADVAVARQAGISEASCATLRTCTMLLKAALLGEGGAAAEAMGQAVRVAGVGQAGTGGGGGGGGVTPKALAAMLMRDQFDQPSPFERLCARALGVAEEELGQDTALTDFVVAHRPEGGADFAPPPEFYTRLASLLEEIYGLAREGAC